MDQPVKHRRPREPLFIFCSSPHPVKQPKPTKGTFPMFAASLVWGFSRWVNLQDHGGSNLSETLWPVYSLNENMSFPYFLSGFGNRYFVQHWEANHFGSRWLSVVCLYYGSQWDPKLFAIKLYHFIISSKAIYSTHCKKTVFFLVKMMLNSWKKH